jgi:DUF4097 and DUF4098 domain-containing protein YvlB
MSRTLCATLGLAIAALVAAPAAHADQWSKTFHVTGTPQLTLHVDNGRVNVTSGAANQVSVTVNTTGWKIPQGVRVIPSQQGNTIEVQVRQNQHWFSFSRGATEVAVTMPSGANLDLSTGNGDVTLSSLNGSLRAGTGNGAIHATDLRGSLALRTANGAIEASSLDGSLRAGTGNGTIRASGRFDALDVSSGRGSVDVAVLAGSKMTSSWSIGSGAGHVGVTLPANFSAELDASTGVGHISAKFPVTVSTSVVGSTVRGRLGAGGATLRVHSGVGDIAIERASQVPALPRSHLPRPRGRGERM